MDPGVVGPQQSGIRDIPFRGAGAAIYGLVTKIFPAAQARAIKARSLQNGLMAFWRRWLSAGWPVLWQLTAFASGLGVALATATGADVVDTSLHTTPRSSKFSSSAGAVII